MKEAKVKSYTRRTKSGKTIKVRAHSRKCKEGSCKSGSSGKELLRKKALVDIADVKDRLLRAAIVEEVEAITDGEYSEKPYTWNDVLTAARNPAEKSVHAYLGRMGIKVSKPTKNTSNAKKTSKKHTSSGSLDEIQGTPGYYISYPLLD